MDCSSVNNVMMHPLVNQVCMFILIYWIVMIQMFYDFTSYK
jgi:hypothetical protein